MKEKNIVCIAYSSLAPLTGWREQGGDNRSEDVKAAIISENEVFKGMADKYGKTEAQLLLRWALQHNYKP